MAAPPPPPAVVVSSAGAGLPGAAGARHRGSLRPLWPRASPCFGGAGNVAPAPPRPGACAAGGVAGQCTPPPPRCKEREWGPSLGASEPRTSVVHSPPRWCAFPSNPGTSRCRPVGCLHPSETPQKLWFSTHSSALGLFVNPAYPECFKILLFP